MKEKMPIALMIGAGSRTPALFEHLDKEDAAALIVCVVSHKALLPDESGNKTIDVVGIQEARKRNIRWDCFNLVQMTRATKEVDPKLDEKVFRQEYFRMLGAYLSQSYPVKPKVVFMLGWDLIVSEEFLKFFPRPDGLYNVINLHPAQLPDDPLDKYVKLPSGTEIPVLKGEHDEVINEAVRLKLPALGACMHFATPEADKGGYIIKRVEVPIIYKDSDQETFDDYEKRLQVAESQLVVDVVNLFAQGKVRIEHGLVRIV